MNKIAVVTSSRADYGVLRPVVRALAEHSDFDARLIVTGTHLSVDHGATRADIDPDLARIVIPVPIVEGSGTGRAATDTCAGAIARVGAVLDELRPRVVVVLGDRFEILACVLAASLLGCAIAHIGGGDVTEGALDDGYRHAITKLSHAHFVTNELARRRVIQLGESPDRVYLAGNPALDAIRCTPREARADLERELGLALGPSTLLATFHPETASGIPYAEQRRRMVAALMSLPAELSLLITGPNIDPGADEIRAGLRDVVTRRPRAVFVESLGPKRFYSVLEHVRAVIGNSSSGICEAPSFGIPTIDVGSRQRGRVRADGVQHVEFDAEAIRAAVLGVLATTTRPSTTNPYGDGHATERIVRGLLELASSPSASRKQFMDLEVPS